MWITISKLEDANACYARDKMEHLFNGRKRVRLHTIMKTDISLGDRLWCLKNLAPETFKEFIWRVLDRYFKSEIPKNVLQVLNDKVESKALRPYTVAWRCAELFKGDGFGYCFLVDLRLLDGEEGYAWAEEQMKDVTRCV